MTAPGKGLFHACDFCGAQADTVHFAGSINDTERVALACPRHEPKGYYFKLSEWFADEHSARQHLVSVKVHGESAAAHADERLSRIFGPTLSPVERVRLALIFACCPGYIRCPLCGHRDFSLDEARDGAALVYCSGCKAETRDIVEEIGLGMRDLFIGRKGDAA